MFVHHRVNQNTEEWENLRCGKVTSSRFSVFMANADKGIWGEPAKRLALQIALERITGNKSEYSFSNEHTQRGHDQEGTARDLYEMEFFVDVESGGFFESSCGLYGCSPDGLVGSDGLIEIKSVIPSTHYATLKRGWVDPAYIWQIIGNISITNRQYCDFISYCSEFPESKQLLVYRVYRKDYEDHIQRLRSRREEFLKLVRTIESEIRDDDYVNYAPVEVGGTILQEA